MSTEAEIFRAPAQPAEAQKRLIADAPAEFDTQPHAPKNGLLLAAALLACALFWAFVIFAWLSWRG